MEMTIAVASAGTGKTKFLIDRVVEDLNSGYSPEDIAFVSFTRAALDEARERISKETGIPAKSFIHFRTIHSMCFNALGFKKNDIMSFKDYNDCSKAIGVQLKLRASDTPFNIDDLDFDDLTDDDIASLEQLYRNNRKEYMRVVNRDGISTRVFYFMKAYSKWRKEHNKSDFTDLLTMYIERGLQSPCKIAYLDEMQDATALQWQVVLQAFAKAERITVAGDDKQAIYTSLGGVDNYINDMQGNHIFLDTSYRVPSNVMKVGNTLAAMMNQSPCQSAKAGGEIKWASRIEDIHIPDEGTVFMLCYARAFRRYFQQYCYENGYNYVIEDREYLSAIDILAYNTGMYSDIPQEKIDFMRKWRIKEYVTPRITISTIHASKGKEADTVILASDIPRKVEKIDEHSRLLRVFYVGATRARNTLIGLGHQTETYYTELLFVFNKCMREIDFERSSSY